MQDKIYKTGEELSEEFLEHFGVMGMKWGVRKDKAASLKKSKSEPNSKKISSELKKADKEWEKKKTLHKNTFELANKAGDDPVFKKLLLNEAAKIAKQYVSPKDQQDVWQMKYSELINKKFIDTPAAYNPSKTKVIQMQPVTEFNAYGQYRMFLRTNVIDVSSIKHSVDEVISDVCLEGDFLAHYGVLGMKWGVTKAKVTSLKKSAHEHLKKKYPINPDPVQELKEVEGSPPAKKAKKVTNKSVKKSYKKANKNRRLLTDDEIKAKVQRLKLEQELNKLTHAELDGGKQVVNKILSDSGKALAKKAIVGGTAYLVKTAISG